MGGEEGQVQVAENVLTHYRNVFHAEVQRVPPLHIDNVPCLVSDDTNANLTRLVRDKEIKEVVFSLGSQKSPGPDGFNGMYYKDN